MSDGTIRGKLVQDAPDVFNQVHNRVSSYKRIHDYMEEAERNSETSKYLERAKDKVEDPLYTPKDLCGITNPVAILARLLCLRFNITKDDFATRHYAYKKKKGKSDQQINTDKGNLNKNLIANRLTVDKLEELVASLGFDIIDYAITVIDKKTGETAEFHSNSSEDFVLAKKKELARDEDD